MFRGLIYSRLRPFGGHPVQARLHNWADIVTWAAGGNDVPDGEEGKRRRSKMQSATQSRFAHAGTEAAVAVRLLATIIRASLIRSAFDSSVNSEARRYRSGR